ncbi:MAG TPA: TonB-dependent receptor [Sphingomicrobium sp.]|nr:TonB-dependent receptor [Sphingomicrobium sp.]
MIDRRFRALTLGFLATTALASPAFAQNVPPETATQPQTTGQSPAPGTNATDVTAPPKAVPVAQQGRVPDQSEIIITATKREENLQNVAISVQVLGNRKLDQLNISNFEQYTKQLPSVTFQNFGAPGFTVVYMRGVATGGDGNHSGSLPSVGSYLDEQPITTIGGTLDVHIYDIARIESLAGPQGTLYGASSEAGTIRIITNKPELGVTTGRVDGEINTVAHGGIGGKLEGMINIPIADHIAFRAVAFYEHDAGYIDNVFGERTYLAPDPADNVHFDNSQFLENDFNDVKTYGGRAALKVDLDDNWTVTPTFMFQKSSTRGVFWMDEGQGDLETVRFQPELAKDRFWQAALTVQGKIANFDLTYAGAYMDRPRYASSDYTDYTDAYDAYYIAYYQSYPSYCTAPGGLLGCQNWTDNNGNIINPRQHIVGTDHFKKMSHEVRLATPGEWPVRGLVGAFYQDQKNHIFQDYLVDNLATGLSVTDYPGTLWLTNQEREDKDWALFGEVNWDITPQITVTGGLRFYKFDNTLYGFAGFGSGNPIGSHTGEDRCLTVNGLEAFTDPDSPLATGNSGLNIPCYNVANIGSNGQAIPRRSKGSGHIHRLNAQWKPQENLMFYVTWSKGFRPGGINRQPETPPYGPDFLTNYEAGWKTTFLGNRLRWNGAIYHQKWESIQFSFLGPNSLTVIQNGRNANVNGIETDINYVAGGLSLTAAAAYTHAETDGNICHAAIVVDPTPDCSGLDSRGRDDFIVVPSGTRLPITPKFKASATARYSWPVWTGKAHVQGVFAYQGSAPADLDPSANDILGNIRSSALVDLFLGYDWSRYSAELFVSNVFDKRNELSRLVVCSICDQVKIIPGRPRTIGFRVGAHF